MMYPTATLDLATQLGPLRVYAEGTITRALQDGQWWDDHLKPAIDSVQHGWAVDIGAHFGWFTAYLASRHERVFACEPWPPSFALLQHNMQHHWAGGLWPHHQGRVQCWPVAAYDSTAVLRFYQGNHPADAGSFAFTPEAPELAAARVVGVRLDDYLPMDAPISLVKCDAQGADLQALRGMVRTIQRCRPLIIFEWEEGLAQQQDTTWDDYLRFFDRLGYTVERITEDYWDFVGRPKP